MSLNSIVADWILSPPPWLRVSVRALSFALVAVCAWKVYHKGLPRDVQQAILHNIWILLSIYVVRLAVSVVNPWGYVLNSLGGLAIGFVVGFGVLRVAPRYAWGPPEERFIQGWTALIGLSLAVPLVLGAAGSISIWLALWFIAGAMLLYNTASHPETGHSLPETDTQPETTTDP